MTFRGRATIFMVALICSFPVFSKDLPSWIYSAQTVPGKLTAVGNGKTIQGAKHVALAEILAQVSQTTSTATRSVLQKDENAGSTYFRQEVTSQSLNIDLNDLHLEKQFKDPSSDNFYVLVSVDKLQVTRFLNDELIPFENLFFPKSDSLVEQLLWSLKYKTSSEYALRLERALAALGAGRPKLQNHLKDNLSQIVSIWQKSGVRIIADNSLSSLVSVLHKHFPTSANTVLWLQLQPQRNTRRIQGVYEEKLTLLVQLNQPTSPFNTYYSKKFSVIGKGSSASGASINAVEKMQEILKQPLQNWFFEKGSNL